MEFVENKDFQDKLKVVNAKHNVGGLFADMVRFIQEEQLMDAPLWAKFVEQYRLQPDAPTLAWRGEYWGKMMRGAVSVYCYAKDDNLYAVLEETVKDMFTVAEEDGRVSTYERSGEFQGWDLWCRKYVLLGMLYFYDICKSDQLKEQIIEFSSRHLDYIIDHIGEGKLDITKASSSWFGINSSSLLEPVVWMYVRTGQKRYLDFADYIVNRGGADRVNVFELAYENKLMPYQYGVSKAYELTSCFEGLIAYYCVTGIEKYKIAAVNYGRAILASDVSIIGSLGCTHELLDHTLVMQTAQRGLREQETCVTVTWMKYCATLYRITGDPAFADAIETSYYNAYLGAFNLERKESDCVWKRFKGQPEYDILKPSILPFDSYSPLTPGVRGLAVGGDKLFADGSYYGCCACIGSVGLGTYASHRLLRFDDGLALSFFDDGNSDIEMDGTLVNVAVSGNYPTNSDVKITVTTDKEINFKFKVRIPAWSKDTVIKADLPFTVKDGFAVFDGKWSGKTDIFVSFDMKVRTLYPITWEEDVVYTDMTGSAGGWHFANAQTVKHLPEYDDYIALTRGPIVLAVDSKLGKSADSVFTFAKENGELVYTENKSDDSMVSLTFVDSDGNKFTLKDYASVGKDWETLITAWMPTK